MVAGLWKSTISSADVVPKKPVLTSAMMPWKVVIRSVPPTKPFFFTRSVTPVITAPSGRPAVLKDRMLRYCLFVAPSPRLMATAALFMVPPVLPASLDSRIQPSCAAIEFNVSVKGVGVWVAVFVEVTVLVGVRVKVAVFVGVWV